MTKSKVLLDWTEELWFKYKSRTSWQVGEVHIYLNHYNKSRKEKALNSKLVSFIKKISKGYKVVSSIPFSGASWKASTQKNNLVKFGIATFCNWYMNFGTKKNIIYGTIRNKSREICVYLKCIIYVPSYPWQGNLFIRIVYQYYYYFHVIY